MEADRNGMVQMKALKFGTVNGPKGNILHTDERDVADKQARYPLVSLADAKHLEKEGFAEAYDGKVPAGEEEMNTDQYAGEMVQETLEADQSTDLPTGLDTRQTTAFQDSPEDMAAGSNNARNLVADNGGPAAAGDDAPAGAKKSSGKAKTE